MVDIKKMLYGFKEMISHHFREVMKTKKGSHSIALGFAIGTFIGILPTPGFNVLFGLLIILLFEKVNKFTLFGALAFWNPITQIPIYTLSYKVGNMFFSAKPVIGSDVLFFDKLYNFSMRYLLGNIILAVAISLASYVMVWGIAEIYRRRKSADGNGNL